MKFVLPCPKNTDGDCILTLEPLAVKFFVVIDIVSFELLILLVTSPKKKRWSY